MLSISLDALQIMDAIDRRGSFSAAGKELFRVPSTISYTVSKLEDELGVQLFERMGPKVSLTPAGQELLTEGRYLLKAASDLESRVRRVASGWETELTICMDAMFSGAALQDDIAAFYQVADQTRLRIGQEVLSGAWEALLDRRADLLIGAAGAGPSGGGYSAEPIGKLPFVFVVAPTHPLARVTRRIGKAELHEHRAIAIADSARHMPVRTVGLLFGQDTLTVADMHTKYQLHLAGLGFGFLPEPYARSAIQRGLLVEKKVEEAKPVETFYMAWRTGEKGAALKWWIERMRSGKLFERLADWMAAMPKD
ncbi:MAG TPA: LysR family transcriptional regulator [Oxalobacteraceae bacterium]|nr:LysR family transcriptional regulator [Oxalobacteraceae bacterium]